MKWYGKVGFIETEEIRPGVWKPTITEREYAGDLIRNLSKWSSKNDSDNNDMTISNQISIISDPYLEKSIHSIRYIEFMGSFWDVGNIEFQYPRLLITIGGVYNGETA